MHLLLTRPCYQGINVHQLEQMKCPNLWTCKSKRKKNSSDMKKPNHFVHPQKVCESTGSSSAGKTIHSFVAPSRRLIDRNGSDPWHQGESRLLQGRHRACSKTTQNVHQPTTNLLLDSCSQTCLEKTTRHPTRSNSLEIGHCRYHGLPHHLLSSAMPAASCWLCPTLILHFSRCCCNSFSS